METKVAKENEVDPDGNEILTPIVTGTGGTEDTGATDNTGAPEGIPPSPRTTRSQVMDQPLTKGEVRRLRS